MPRAAKILIALCLVCLTSAVAAPQGLAHMAGSLDHYGCHADRRKGGYHCHSGSMSGRSFASKAAMLRGNEPGQAAPEEPAPPAAEEEESGGWKIPSLFKGSDDSASGSSSVTGTLVPSGIAKRLRILKGLHDEGLITEEEYAAKRKDILGEL